VSAWLRLARLLKPHSLHVCLAVCLAIAACALALAAPLVVQWLLTTAAGRNSQFAIILPTGALLAVVAAQALAGTANAWLLGSTALKIVQSLRHSLYQRLQQMPLAWLDRTPTGTIMSRLMDDVSVVQGLASSQTLVALIDLATAVAAATWLAGRSLRLALVVAAIMPIYVLIFRVFTRRIRSSTGEVRRQLDQVFSQLKQKIDGLQVVRAVASEPAEIASFTRQIAALHWPRVEVNSLGIAFSNLCMGVGGAGAVVVFAVGAGEVLSGQMQIGDLIAASALAGLLFTPMTRLSELAAQHQQAAASFARLSEILDYPLVETAPVAHGRESAASDVGQAGRINFNNVAFHYVAGRPILHNVSLQIEPGTKVAIVGPTGSGKTTLMNLLLRFYEPTNGDIWLDDRRLTDLTTSELRQAIGVVPQETVIFRGTLRDNIRYGTPDASQTAVESAARAAQMHDVALTLPQGYDTVVGEGGYPLSQGQRQRISLARLFCKNSPIVVLDEATSSLDRDSESLVKAALDRLLAGRTTFVIAHRLATVLEADRIIVMDQGRIVQSGTHAELLAEADGLYRQLYDSQLDSLAEQSSDRGPRRPGPASPAQMPHYQAIPA
jgi:subfamily B ATP-binding cassette protein MsbA